MSKYSKAKVVMSIIDNQIKTQIIQNPELLEEIFDRCDFLQFLLTADDEIKNYITSDKDYKSIKDIAIKNGMITFDDSLESFRLKSFCEIEESDLVENI